MDINKNTWIPFSHDNLEYKQRVLQIAREQKLNEVSGALTATLIYVNAVDYVASHLLENLRVITYLILHNETNGAFFYKNEKLDNQGLPLGKIISKLKKYSFPDKTTFIKDLEKFNDLRIKYVHNFLSFTKKDLEEKVDIELRDLYTTAEAIILRYDTIVRGMTDIWNVYVLRKSPMQQVTSEQQRS